MSAEPDDTPEAPAPVTTDRDQMLDLLEDGIEEAHRKVTSGRVYDAEAEKVRIQWIRALAYAVSVYRQALKDRDLDDLAARLDRLEAADPAERWEP